MGDFSQNYTQNKKGYIFFNLGNKTVRFKPFIDSFSFVFSSIIAVDEELNIYNRETLVDGYNPAEYSLKFNVVATNIEEAIANHKKFQKLLRMILPMKDINLDTPKKITALFSNLISSKGFTGRNNFDPSRAFDCIISDLNYSPDMDMGFFEYNGLLFAKAYSLDVKMSSTEKSNKKINNIPYFKSGFNYGRKSNIQAQLKSEEQDSRIIQTLEQQNIEEDPAESLNESDVSVENIAPQQPGVSVISTSSDETPVEASTEVVIQETDTTTNSSDDAHDALFGPDE